MTVVALIGAKALYLLYGWLLSAIVGAYISDRKGYGEKPGLAAGLLLTVLGVVIWLVWPARENSKWKVLGPIGKSRASRRAGRFRDAEPKPPKKPEGG